jgi:TrmH family RNA methyltransferase
VSWSYHRNGVDAVLSLKEKGYEVLSLESGPGCQSLFNMGEEQWRSPAVLVVGNELAGVDPAILSLSDVIASIPMSGRKGSLNAAVALGIAAYWLQYGFGSSARGL